MDNQQHKKRILFRADGNTEIGLGHIYRCLAIAERVNEKFDCFFAIRQPSEEIKNIIGKSSAIVELDQFENYLMDAQEVALNIIPRYKIDIITLDGYYFNTEYQKTIKKNCKSILISIDDNHPFHYVSDIVINHAGGVDTDMISKESNTKLFLGYDYLLLRKEFIKLLHTEKKISGIHSVLICFGGADPNDFTGKTLDCLINEKNIHKIIIIVGASYTQTINLKKLVAEKRDVEIMSNLDSEILAEVMNNTDLAIVPASTISLEAFASKMIIITGMTADNQKNIYQGLIKEDTVLGIGNFNRLTCEELRNSVAEVFKKFTGFTFNKRSNNSDSVLEVFKSSSL